MTWDGRLVGETAEDVLDAIRGMPHDSLERLLNAWSDDRKAMKNSLEETAGLSGEATAPLRRLVADPAVNTDMLGAMLAAGLKARSNAPDSGDRVEIVWTGPSRISLGIRNTRPVIEEMLRSATPEETVTVVGYQITGNAKSVIDGLNKCLRSGTKIDIIMDKSRANRREIARCFAPRGLTRPTIYTRMGKEPQLYKVHAKVIMIGDRQMLVSSANLTGLGTEVNFEIGLLASGPVVKSMHRMIRRMIDDGYFAKDDAA